MPTSLDAVDGFEQQLEQAALRVPELIAALEADRDAIDVRIRRLRKFRAAYVEEEQPRKRSRTKPKSQADLRRAITLEVAEHVLAQETVDPGFEFTPRQLKQQLGHADSSTAINQALAALRSIEFVARTRKEGNNQFYAIDRAERIEQVRDAHQR